MEDALKSRIKYLLKEKDCTLIELGGNENQRCKLSRQINGSIGVSLNTVQDILTKFPDVSAEWLLRGEGTMSKADHLAPHIYANGGSVVQNGHHQGDVTIDTPSQYELYGKDAIITAKDDQIAMLRDQVLHLQQDKQQLHLLLNALTQPTCSKH